MVAQLENIVLDFGLAALHANVTHVVLCSSEPTTYAAALSYQIGYASLGAGNAFGAPSPGFGGMQVASAYVTTGTIVTTGTVNWMAGRPLDPLSAMAKRGQISRAEFRAAIAYRKATDRTALERVIAAQSGSLGLGIVQDVLAGISIGDVAKANGAGSREAAAFGWLLRRSLSALAVRLGYMARQSSQPLPSP